MRAWLRRCKRVGVRKMVHDTCQHGMMIKPATLHQKAADDHVCTAGTAQPEAGEIPAAFHQLRQHARRRARVCTPAEPEDLRRRSNDHLSGRFSCAYCWLGSAPGVAAAWGSPLRRQCAAMAAGSGRELGRNSSEDGGGRCFVV
jgi:hypothetical protein